MLCQYRDIFGKPNQGVHQYRFMNIAIVDLLLTVAIAIFIGYLIHKNWLLILLILLLLAIFIHRLFCVNTALNVAIFGKV